MKGSPRDRKLNIISILKTAHYIVVGIIQVNDCLKYACHKRRRKNNRLFRHQDDPDAYCFGEYIHIGWCFNIIDHIGPMKQRKILARNCLINNNELPLTKANGVYMVLIPFAPVWRQQSFPYYDEYCRDKHY